MSALVGLSYILGYKRALLHGEVGPVLSLSGTQSYATR
jgi:hypothetical protein